MTPDTSDQVKSSVINSWHSREICEVIFINDSFDGIFSLFVDFNALAKRLCCKGLDRGTIRT